MLVGVLVQGVEEEGAAGGDNYFVNLLLLVITSNSNIKEVFIITQFSDSKSNSFGQFCEAAASKLFSFQFINL